MNRKDLVLNILKEGITDELWEDEEIKILQETYTAKFYE